MKTFLLLLGISFGASIYVQYISEGAQEGKEFKKQQMAKEARYWCPKGDYSSANSGSCPNHNISMVKEGVYYCPVHPDQTSDKEEKCPIDGTPMIKMEGKTPDKGTLNEMRDTVKQKQ